jgi:hypothetical protein
MYRLFRTLFYLILSFPFLLLNGQRTVPKVNIFLGNHDPLAWFMPYKRGQHLASELDYPQRRYS